MLIAANNANGYRVILTVYIIRIILIHICIISDYSLSGGRGGFLPGLAANDLAPVVDTFPFIGFRLLQCADFRSEPTDLVLVYTRDGHGVLFNRNREPWRNLYTDGGLHIPHHTTTPHPRAPPTPPPPARPPPPPRPRGGRAPFCGGGGGAAGGGVGLGMGDARPCK